MLKNSELEQLKKAVYVKLSDMHPEEIARSIKYAPSDDTRLIVLAGLIAGRIL